MTEVIQSLQPYQTHLHCLAIVLRVPAAFAFVELSVLLDVLGVCPVRADRRLTSNEARPGKRANWASAVKGCHQAYLVVLTSIYQS